MYFPWPGFFSHIALADVLIWLDDAQFSKGSFSNRVQVLQKDKVHWMTIPLEGHGSFQKINELKPGKKDWVNQHRAMLQQSFKNKELGNISLSLFDEVTNLSKQQKLSKTLISSCEVLASYLQVLPPNVIVSSDINVGGKSQSVFKFARKHNPKIKRIKADKNQPLPLRQDMNLNKLNKII